eukprot:CAMPEP_0174917654 /NCGR_PEP_ID=MMETSP1355-20121228/2602_1 /TAXON_ID=464990 /ORGANISM="Hemiselmis tepida, Strain CCMP443" /LENGTH=143 /DNA_ID=CAMNT_0016162771 /DNA_START=135 /DNA_END=563 /DNA_ORIENTATION=+
MAEQDTSGAPREVWEREQQQAFVPPHNSQPPFLTVPTTNGASAKGAKSSAASSAGLLADYRADLEGGKSMAQGQKKGLAFHNASPSNGAMPPHHLPSLLGSAQVSDAHHLGAPAPSVKHVSLSTKAKAVGKDKTAIHPPQQSP